MEELVFEPSKIGPFNFLSQKKHPNGRFFLQQKKHFWKTIASLGGFPSGIPPCFCMCFWALIFVVVVKHFFLDETVFFCPMFLVRLQISEILGKNVN